jgi:hypothetical protein
MVETPTIDETTHQELTKLPLDGEKSTTILLNVEEDIKSIITKLAKRVEIDGVDIKEEDLAHLPTSITGVVVHFITKGLKNEFGIAFENEPRSLKIRGIASNYDKKVAGKKRLLTRDQKNELLAKTSMTYYETKIASGEMTIDNVMHAIKDAFERKRNFEEMGYMLPPEKTKYPYWLGEEVNDDDI